MLHLHLPFLLLLSMAPSLPAGGSAASNVDDVGFWLGFTLLVIVSSVEAAMSVLWTRIRVTSDDIHPCEFSCCVCGHEIILASIDRELGLRMATEGLSGSCCSCGSTRPSVSKGKAETTVDSFCSVSMVSFLMMRRFNPSTSLKAPTGLLNDFRVLFKPGSYTVGRVLEHGVNLIVGLMDISLQVTGLALNPRSPEALYAALKDPKAPLTFENYSTLFLLYWLLGAVLLICMLPTSSERMSVRLIFGMPGGIAFLVASLASIVLFGLGCWKIDVARKAHEDWTPMLSYWIGGATATSFPCCGLEIFHIFGLVGLVFILKHDQ